MKARHLGMLATLLLGFSACSSVPVSGDGIVALELLVPVNLTIAPTDSVILRARALDINGDSVAAAIRWFTIDTLTISVDSVSGVVHPILTAGTGRVQAGVGTLRSDLISITIQNPSP